jgi:ABC-type phosphate transport system substrate-binding protein
MQTKHCLAWLFVLMVFGLTTMASAQDYIVVVHPKNDATLTKSDVANIFLGKMRKFPQGKEAVPVMQESTTAITQTFVKTVVSKSWAQFRSYWSRRMFSGKGYPPKRFPSDKEIKAHVAKNENSIGIISSKAVDDSVRVVAKF